MTATRTRALYFDDSAVQAIVAEVRNLEHNLNRRAPFIGGEVYCDALDRIEAVRLAVKRLSDFVVD